MDKTVENLEKTLSTLSGLEERLGFIAEAEDKLAAKAENLGSQIDDLFTLERELEDKIGAVETLLNDIANMMRRYDDLKATHETTANRLGKLDIQKLQSSVEETTDAVSKTEKALLAAEKRNKESKDKLRPAKK